MSGIRKLVLKIAKKNSSFRRVLLSSLVKEGMEHASEKALKEYLKKHPDADPKNHTVKTGPNKGQDKLKSPLKDSERGKAFPHLESKYKDIDNPHGKPSQIDTAPRGTPLKQLKTKRKW